MLHIANKSCSKRGHVALFGVIISCWVLTVCSSFNAATLHQSGDSVGSLELWQSRRPPWRVWRVLSHFILTRVRWGGFYCPHFTGVESERREEKYHPRAQRDDAAESRFNPTQFTSLVDTSLWQCCVTGRELSGGASCAGGNQPGKGDAGLTGCKALRKLLVIPKIQSQSHILPKFNWNCKYTRSVFLFPQ